MRHQNASLRYQARRELLVRLLPRYRAASVAQKSLLLDAFCQMTGYARKSAIRLLNHPPERSGPLRRSRTSTYDPEIRQALFLAWKATHYVCAKRLLPSLPTMIAMLEKRGYLQLTEEERRQLLAMSVSTAERYLRTQRKPSLHSLPVLLGYCARTRSRCASLLPGMSSVQAL